MSARLQNLNPYELHKYLVNVYRLNSKGSTGHLRRDTSKDRTDIDVIRENNKFLWEEDDVADTWEKQLAKKYYDKLFKEYCICDLSRYKENKVSWKPLQPPLIVTQRKQAKQHFISSLKYSKQQAWDLLLIISSQKMFKRYKVFERLYS